ncbi:ras-specific guanine nucleotide-releasing factor RalGPS2-like isoform X3 [Petromyzon marinus]|uniref:ras-specific guanine nucleotide-releasing factor RalGPS2-like isoform X3 n=1 Tax=Petromyzon marinus TaxID=7757 RepID=UPI003F6ED18B
MEDAHKTCAAESPALGRAASAHAAGPMEEGKGQASNFTLTAATPEESSGSDSTDGRWAVDPKRKSYDAVLFDVLKVAPEELASQITLMDAPVFKSIQPEELSSCGWNRKEKHSLAPNVVAFTRRFNHVSFWVIREILEAQTLKIRAEILSHFIKIAKKLYELNNLHALMAVISGLLSAPIFRLSKTWACLSRRDKATFDKLDYLMSKEDNHARLREYIQSLKMTPCIPYLGIYLSDVVYIDSAHPASGSILESEKRSLHMNNILRVISDFQQFCQYDFLPMLLHVQKYLQSVQYIEELQKFVEDDNYKQSLRIEPASSTPQLAMSKEDLTGPSDLSSSPRVGRRPTAPEALSFHSPGATPPLARHTPPCCHRKSRSLGSSFVGPQSGTESKSMTLPAVRPRHLLDDSVIESSSPLRTATDASFLSSGLSIGSSEGSELSEELSYAGFDSTLPLPPHVGQMTKYATWSAGHRSRCARVHFISSSLDLDDSPLPPPSSLVNLEGALKRRTILKEGRRPTMSPWTRYWISLCGADLYFYSAKSMKVADRKHFKSRPSKKVHIAGWMVVRAADPDHSTVFQLTDPERGNVYKFQAVSDVNASLWVKHLDKACKSNIAQPPDNLMTFE